MVNHSGAEFRACRPLCHKIYTIVNIEIQCRGGMMLQPRSISLSDILLVSNALK